MPKLGQHFLIHDSSLSKIAKSLRALPREKIIEIGGGHGELTAHLTRQYPGNRIDVIEKDLELAHGLIKKFEGNPNVQVKAGSALEIFPRIIRPSFAVAGTGGPMNNFRVIANLPYYITGHFLRMVGETRPLPDFLVLLIQKEVAERVSAQPPRMNRLAASVQIWGEPKIVFRVPRTHFRPPPAVESAVIEITPYSHQRTNLDSYYETVRIVFAQPRKTAFNNINILIKNRAETLNILSAAGIDPNSRPQNLGISQIKKLSNSLRQISRNSSDRENDD